ncbi:MAG: biotin/lipoyl-binding protein [Thermoguttaceae bacterium]
MVTLRDSLLSSSARKLPIRKRPDLVAKRQHYLGRSYWVVKDPVGLNYYRFQEEEFAILQMLDGETSLDEIKDRFEEDFPPQKITLEELQQFLGMLHRSGLVITDLPGQGRQLGKRRGERKRKQFLAAAANVLCIRFKGFDPERFLNWIYPYVRWFFSPWAVAASLLLALAALLLVTVNFEQFRNKLPEFHQFFSVGNAFLLALTLGVTKVFHEFGHGLSCKHFGGECHEMGVMILVLTPCLYCNVSDSWMLPSKWRRAAIGAAGIYVELVLASICTFIWWSSYQHLLVNKLCLNVMFICSVSTVIFNANPLLRYDGYYILSDLMEIPNLRQKATTILGRKLSEWCLGMEPPEDPFLPQRNQVFFALYSVAATIYRWIVALSICWFLYRFFVSNHLEIIGKGMVAASLWGLFVMPLYQAGKFFYVPGRIDQVKKPYFYTSLGIVVALVAAFFFLPLPYSVICPLEIQPRDREAKAVDPDGAQTTTYDTTAQPVYVVVPGTLVSVDVKPGQWVKKGQPLARLQNLDLDLEIVKLQGDLRTQEARRRSLMRQSTRDPHAASQISQVQESLKALTEELEEKMADQRRLLLVAPLDGMVLPPSLTTRHEDPEEKLPAWSGTPLDRENLGAALERDTVFCQVGDPTRLDAVLVVDQADRNMIQDGLPADIKLEGFAAPSMTVHSKIREVAEAECKVVPQRLSTKGGGDVPTKTDQQTGIERPISACYLARIPIDDAARAYRIGLRGQARVYTRWLPLGARLWRVINHTFNFKV